MGKRVLSVLVWAVALCSYAAELPIWFDTFQAPLESRRAWQTFRAADALSFAEEGDDAGGGVMRAHVRFCQEHREAILIWRFPDVQMRSVRMWARIPESVPDGEILLRVISNDTQGDALFFRPYSGETKQVDWPGGPNDGDSRPTASPLPRGRWVVYEARLPDDVFHEQRRAPAEHPVHDFSLMNIGRDALQLSGEDRPALEALFFSFQVTNDSPLIGREMGIEVGRVELY